MQHGWRDECVRVKTVDICIYIYIKTESTKNTTFFLEFQSQLHTCSSSGMLPSNGAHPDVRLRRTANVLTWCCGMQRAILL
jgi:hypothetical protein